MMSDVLVLIGLGLSRRAPRTEKSPDLVRQQPERPSSLVDGLVQIQLFYSLALRPWAGYFTLPKPQFLHL